MKTIAEELEHIIKTGTKKYPIPQKIGNSIRLGKVVIRYSKKHNHYKIFDCVDQEYVAETQTKYGALATAKQYVANRDIDRVLYLDRQYTKHYNDCASYKNILKHTDDPVKYDIIQTRLDISECKLDSVVYDLEHILFD